MNVFEAVFGTHALWLWGLAKVEGMSQECFGLVLLANTNRKSSIIWSCHTSSTHVLNLVKNFSGTPAELAKSCHNHVGYRCHRS